jgi:hypothetical protein
MRAAFAAVSAIEGAAALNAGVAPIQEWLARCPGERDAPGG